MHSPYRVHLVVCASGERLPLLLARSDGQPLFLPNLFAISQIRGRSQAANTIERCLRSISLLLFFAERQGIDLEDRILSGQLLGPAELDRLVEVARAPLHALASADEEASPSRVRRHRPLSLERYRRPQRPSAATMVADDTAATSLRFMHAYLSWATARRLARLDQDDAAYVRYAASRDLLLSSLTARIPESGQARSEDEQREGLSEEQRRALTSTVETHSATNPWVDPKAKVRNQLISLWLLHLGLRGGELLSIRIDDIDFRQNVVSVVRRPDAADDPRRRQPLVKTRGRSLPIDCVASLTQHYIFEVRRVLPEARKHPFLFVEVKRGRPMSYSALTKIFAALKACDGIPPSVTPHVMRHTWNDAFSAAMDTSKTPEPAERSMRAFLQGWAPGSETAAVYTRRHVRERARSALVRLQAEMVTRVPK